MATKKTTKKTEEEKVYTVEVVSSDFDMIKAYELKGYSESDILAIKRFLYDVDYVGAKTIRIEG
jgi:hypothetical protein